MTSYFPVVIFLTEFFEPFLYNKIHSWESRIWSISSFCRITAKLTTTNLKTKKKLKFYQCLGTGPGTNQKFGMDVLSEGLLKVKKD